MGASYGEIMLSEAYQNCQSENFVSVDTPARAILNITWSILGVAGAIVFNFVGLMQLFEWKAMWKLMKSQKGRTVDEINYDYNNTGGVVNYKQHQRRMAIWMSIYFLIHMTSVTVVEILT